MEADLALEDSVGVFSDLVFEHASLCRHEVTQLANHIGIFWVLIDGTQTVVSLPGRWVNQGVVFCSDL